MIRCAPSLFLLLVTLWLASFSSAAANTVLIQFDGFMDQTKTPGSLVLPNGKSIRLSRIRSSLYGKPFAKGDTALVNVDTGRVTIIKKTMPAELLNSRRFKGLDKQREVARWSPQSKVIEIDNGEAKLNQEGAVIYAGRMNYNSYRKMKQAGGVVDDDADNDNVPDANDNCPTDANPGQTDTDADGRGDVCDSDDDNDGVSDINDTNRLNPQICTDSDNDLCDDCAIGDDGFGANSDFFPNNDGIDTDADGLCDAGDPDIDDDNSPNGEDNCPLVSNENQTNTDGDPDGDACDADDDNDGVMDSRDDVPLNPLLCQDLDADLCDDCAIGVDGFGPEIDANVDNDGPDLDSDGVCDVSDTDLDGDDINNDIDNCPVDANPLQEDQNGNGVGDVCDVLTDDELCLPIAVKNGGVTLICL